MPFVSLKDYICVMRRAARKYTVEKFIKMSASIPKLAKDDKNQLFTSNN